jgi:hypothetical protein
MVRGWRSRACIRGPSQELHARAAASLARSRACWALIFAPRTPTPNIRRLDGPPTGSAGLAAADNATRI